jgi:hypothetical protein
MSGNEGRRYVSKTKFVVVLAIVTALTVASAFGAGWKWRRVSQGPPQRVAGWIWDEHAPKGNA